LRAVVPELAALREASAIRIQRSWSGLAEATEERYVLDRQGERFARQVTSSSPRLAPGRTDPPRPVAVPGAAAEGFRRTLAEVPVREGEYHPRTTRTDDRPSIEIAVDTTAGEVVFFSQSQGEDRPLGGPPRLAHLRE